MNAEAYELIRLLMLMVYTLVLFGIFLKYWR